VDVWGAITVLVRRFYLTVPIVGIALVLGALYAGKTAPEYHGSASVVMIGPTAVVAKDVPHPINPYATLGTATVVAAIQIDASSVQSLTQLVQAGNGINFSVTQNGKTPILDIATTSRSPRQALSTATQLISIIQTDLATRQQPYTSVKANQVTLQVLSPATVGGADKSARKKALTIAIGVAVVLGILITLLIDGILRSRSRGRRDGPIWEPPMLEREPSDHRMSVVKH
jgi:capsular polysaccharide biosynthesis protein